MRLLPGIAAIEPVSWPRKIQCHSSDDDTATIIMAESNLQREGLLPSERTYACKMKLEATEQQGVRTSPSWAEAGMGCKSSRK